MVVRLGGTGQTPETMDGRVDEFRISLGARYTGNFVPPTHLTSDATTLVSLLLDEGTGTTSKEETTGAMSASLVGGASWNLSTR
jgi:hypothetical protein